MAKDQDLIDLFRSLVRKFDDTCYLGEILATIADSCDQESGEHESADVKKRREIATAFIATAIDELHTFGEDIEWREWEAFLDKVHASDFGVQAAMIQEIIQVLRDPEWQKGLLELNMYSGDFAKAIKALDDANAALCTL